MVVHERHIHGMVLVLPRLNIVFRTIKQLPNAKYWILENLLKFKFLSACLPYLPTSLTIFKKVEFKQRNTWPPNFATITNSPVWCVFPGSNEYLVHLVTPFIFMIILTFLYCLQAFQCTSTEGLQQHVLQS